MFLRTGTGAKMNLGFMQGRLSPMYNGKIQKFPIDHWKSEFFIAKSLNINLIEWTIDEENFDKNPIVTKKGNEEILNLIIKTGVKIHSITTDCFMQKPIWLKKNNYMKKKLSKLIRFCGNLKIKYIIFPLVDNSSLKKFQNLNEIIKIFINFQNLLKKHNVQILFESDFKPKHLKNFISKFNNRFFGINYDSGNSASLGYDVSNEFKHYGSFIKNIHIKDRIRNGNTIKLGMGNANFNKLFKNIKRIRYKNNLILQTARSGSGEHIKELIDNINFVRKFKI